MQKKKKKRNFFCKAVLDCKTFRLPFGEEREEIIDNYKKSLHLPICKRVSNSSCALILNVMKYRAYNNTLIFKKIF